MAINFDKSLHTPPSKTQKLLFATQVFLRLLAIAATSAAACVMLTTSQTTVVYGIQVDARYSYSSAFKFLAYANVVASVCSLLSLFLAFLLTKTALHSTHFFYFFLHDLTMTVLLIAGCSAATAIAYVGKYGNTHTGWMPICDNFGKFCNRIITSGFLSYVGFAVYLILTIISAKKSQQLGA
ncbi:CASP-like protein 1F1 [Sesamum angolense]|uniref:CASP-like protein n=1 Tax=Sesamum angolense TaxID=2727404 RepID=A0AAE1XFB5_9LAMI|nr:CASP-like protein 1F1 [Sesamum angolense]